MPKYEYLQPKALLLLSKFESCFWELYSTATTTQRNEEIINRNIASIRQTLINKF